MAFWKAYLGGKCAECGATSNLEFDHIDPATKTDDIARLCRRRDEIVIEELKKCQLLCSACHARKSNRHQGGIEHGTRSAYRHHKCRCEKCRMAQSAYMREYDKRRKAQKRTG